MNNESRYRTNCLVLVRKMMKVPHTGWYLGPGHIQGVSVSLISNLESNIIETIGTIRACTFITQGMVDGSAAKPAL